MAEMEHPLDSMRKGVAPRTAPSFREERMTRIRWAESSLLVVGGGGGVTELAEDMFEENVTETLKSRKKEIRVAMKWTSAVKGSY